MLAWGYVCTLRLLIHLVILTWWVRVTHPAHRDSSSLAVPLQRRHHSGVSITHHFLQTHKSTHQSFLAQQSVNNKRSTQNWYTTLVNLHRDLNFWHYPVIGSVVHSLLRLFVPLSLYYSRVQVYLAKSHSTLLISAASLQWPPSGFTQPSWGQIITTYSTL